MLLATPSALPEILLSDSLPPFLLKLLCPSWWHFTYASQFFVHFFFLWRSQGKGIDYLVFYFKGIDFCGSSGIVQSQMASLTGCVSVLWKEIQHAEEFLIKPESRVAQLDTSQWPLLLKVCVSHQVNAWLLHCF